MEKSNVELINSLRSNLLSSKQAFAPALNCEEPSHTLHQSNLAGIKPQQWTARENGSLFVPSVDFSQTGLAEDRSQYDITAKLFFLNNEPLAERSKQVQDAVGLVLKQLHMPCLDLLIVSFPGISFDKSNDCQDAVLGKTVDSAEGEDLDDMVRTWRAIEALQEKKLALRIGIAEFGLERLQDFLPRAKVRPSVDQINVKDICLAPTPLIEYAKQEKIEVLTHSDCTNILPSGTLRELLGTSDKGAGVILGPDEMGDGLKGDIKPQWVIKYTAVVRDRGVIEDKGYFAEAVIDH